MKNIFWILIVSLFFGHLKAIAQQIEVNFYTWRVQDKAVWDTINQRNLIPGVKVSTYSFTRNMYEDFIKMGLQNKQVDLFLWKPGASNLQELIDYDLIAPFTGDLSMINPSALVASKGSNNEYYGVAFAVQLQSIIVNKKLVTKYGINTRPNSMDELYQAFDLLKAQGVTPIHIAGGANWYMAQVLAEVLVAGMVEEQFAQNLIDGNACFTDPAYRAVFETLATWVQRGYVNDDAASGDYGVMSKEVGMGNSAMSIEGGWMIGPTSMFYEIDPQYEFDFWSVPGNSNKVYVLGDGSFQIAANSKKQAALDKVLHFTTTREFAEIFAAQADELPAYGLDFTIHSPVLNSMATNAANKAYGVSLFNDFAINRGEPSYNTLVIEALRGILDSAITPQQATENIQDGLNSWNYIGSANCQ